jgi:hypothetical protein
MQTIYRILSLLFVAVLLISLGCATVVSSPQQVNEATKVSLDPYDNYYSVSGMKLDLGGFPNITKVYMRGGFDKTGTNEFIQLYVFHWSQTGWNFFDQASDISGTPLDVHQLGRQVKSGTVVEEHVAIDLPRDFLESRKNQGLNIRLLGSKGYLIVEIPSPYLTGFLEKYDSAINGFKNSAVVANKSELKPSAQSSALGVLKTVAWGTSASSFSGLKPFMGKIEGGKDIKFFTRDGDPSTFGKASLDKIVYGFWKDKLLSVRFFTNGNANWQVLKDTSFKNFGAGTENPEMKNSYIWITTNTMINLIFRERDSQGILLVASKDILDQKVKQEKIAAQ